MFFPLTKRGSRYIKRPPAFRKTKARLVQSGANRVFIRRETLRFYHVILFYQEMKKMGREWGKNVKMQYIFFEEIMLQS